ncbi:low molecular weight phosphotyrosine protein phosphatase [Psychromonas sp. RZ22]|uniref:low molecular weight protein-tyrosine-phosphatase n=1 Tax=Psychromonas algarum TaxID=2555643 RepID=UPI001068897F|nr:low molecular weight protein-tyrosine-phosphatase [Psychromonas sp. RZ22]TEW55974.1 low molecular weight phosphotyrosine protein phosphatase [Psychromonas sp. RZ22]
MKKILIVCLGNICRSPTAEAVLKAKAKLRGINIEVDSAGTINHHQGKGPDQRSRAAGERRGYSFQGITSRPVTTQDFAYFDYIFAADRQNKIDLLTRCPEQYADKIALFLSLSDVKESEIPDPYYGGEQGFELVLDLLEKASDQLLDKIG